jgi:hypothetical protein
MIVAPGQVIAYAGETGIAYGAHHSVGMSITQTVGQALNDYIDYDEAVNPGDFFKWGIDCTDSAYGQWSEDGDEVCGPTPGSGGPFPVTLPQQVIAHFGLQEMRPGGAAAAPAPEKPAAPEPEFTGFILSPLLVGEAPPVVTMPLVSIEEVALPDEALADEPEADVPASPEATPSEETPPAGETPPAEPESVPTGVILTINDVIDEPELSAEGGEVPSDESANEGQNNEGVQDVEPQPDPAAPAGEAPNEEIAGNDEEQSNEGTEVVWVGTGGPITFTPLLPDEIMAETPPVPAETPEKPSDQKPAPEKPAPARPKPAPPVRKFTPAELAYIEAVARNQKELAKYGLRGNNNPEIIHNFVTDHMGVTPEGAVGLIGGNLVPESGLDFKRMQNSWRGVCAPPPPRIDPYGLTKGEGVGLTQTTFHTRQVNLQRMADSMGLPWYHPAVQLNFLKWEMETQYPGVLQVLRTTRSIEEAATVVLMHFERPASVLDGDPAPTINARIEMARNYAAAVMSFNLGAWDVACDGVGQN